MMEQEKKLEDPKDETRVRFLEGNDMTPLQLKDKIQEVRFLFAFSSIVNVFVCVNVCA